MAPKNYPLDVRVKMTIISTGDVIIDQDIQTYGGRIGILTSCLTALVSDAMRKYAMKVSAGEIRLPSTRTIDRNTRLDTQEGLEIPAPPLMGKHESQMTPLELAIEHFVKGAYAHLESIGWPGGAEGAEAMMQRQQRISEFMAGVTDLEPDGLLPAFMAQFTPRSSEESLEPLGLDPEVATLLVSAGFDTVEKVMEADSDQLIAIKGIGPKRLEEIIAAVEAYTDPNKE